MKRPLPFAIIGTVFIIAVGAFWLLFHVKKQRITAAKIAAIAAAKQIASSAKVGATPPHIRGLVNAPVTLEEFGDFQCQPCGDLSPILEKLEQDYSDRLRVIFRQFPLGMHVRALEAARASEAAGLQGHFWEMHDLLYRERFAWPRETNVRKTFSEYANTLGLDAERFIKDMESELVNGRIAADQWRGRSLGVDRTPAIFINDRAIAINALNPPGLHAAIDAVLKEKSERGSK